MKKIYVKLKSLISQFYLIPERIKNLETKINRLNTMLDESKMINA